MMTTELTTRQGPTMATKDSLTRDLRRLVGRADDLLKETGHAVAGEFAATRQAISQNACRAASATGEYTRENPWKVVGLAALAGLVIGALLSRR
ncbi:MAG TPA: hypothetical protein PK225_07130 [Azonexus sp.]|nr:hypothetical protein [Azonexus sp.]